MFYSCLFKHFILTPLFLILLAGSISFSDTPKVQHAPEGENGVVLCNIKSDAHPVVTWYFKGRQIKKSKFELFCKLISMCN